MSIERFGVLAVSATLLLFFGMNSVVYALSSKGCSQDVNDRTYAQLGAHEFATSNYQIMSEDSFHRMPAPPNPLLPNDPKGCSGNPFQTTQIGKMKLDRNADNTDSPLETMVDIERINLFYQNTEAFDRTKDYDYICTKIARRLDVGDHLKACSYGLPSQGDQKLGIGEHLLIKADDSYKTPLGLPFFADCGFTSCHIQYGLYKDVLVDYNFIITDKVSFAEHFQELRQQAMSSRTSVAFVPLDQIITFDKIIRQRITNAEIKG